MWSQTSYFCGKENVHLTEFMWGCLDMLWLQSYMCAFLFDFQPKQISYQLLIFGLSLSKFSLRFSLVCCSPTNPLKRRRANFQQSRRTFTLIWRAELRQTWIEPEFIQLKLLRTQMARKWTGLRRGTVASLTKQPIVCIAFKSWQMLEFSVTKSIWKLVEII